MTAIDQSRSFPPPDPWLAGEDLNYYYLGQYLIGFVMRLAGTGPTESYNLGVALVWALGASAAFGLGAAATATLRRGSGLLGGGLAALLTVVGGNFEGLRLALAHDGPIAELSLVRRLARRARRASTTSPPSSCSSATCTRT